MTLDRLRCVFPLSLALLVAVATWAQEPATDEEKGPTDPYEKLAESKEAKERGSSLLAQRYLNLIRLQEWSSASGKSKVNARYVAHDPKLTWVKLAAVTGSGKTRVVKEIQVDYAKLHKTCQSRIRQIDLLKKKLDEAIRKGPDGTGLAMTDEQGVDPNSALAGVDPAAAVTDPNAGVPGAAVVDSADMASGADEEDPLGFGEIVIEGPPGVPGEGVAPPEGGPPTGESVPQ